MDIPQILIDQIKDGKAILFLGSGAAIGATHPKNINPPVGDGLSKLIADKFLSPDFYNRPLTQISELAISETDLLTVQSFVADLFKDFYPADFHKLIPKFTWKAIAATNYDLIVERAYDSVEDKSQELVVFKKNIERVEEKLRSHGSVCYFKLHGCITDINDPNIPLILTPDQYVTARKGRNRLFERIESLAYEYPFIFVGHSLSDLDIRAILLEIGQIQEAKPRSYIIAPHITPPEQRFWESRRFSCIKSSFADFINQINSYIPEPFRKLAALKIEREHPFFDDFCPAADSKPSESLMTLLNRDTEYINKRYKSSKADPKAFYKGYIVDWSPIIDELDVRRSLTDNILSETILSNEEDRSEIVELFLIKGHAGAGKSVLLRRLAWEAAVNFDKICLSVKPSGYPEYEPLFELYNICRKRIFLFVDPFSKFIDIITKFIIRVRKDNLPLTIIGAERNNVWNSECEDLKSFLTDSYEVRYLSEKEIEKLIALLTKHNSLGYLEKLDLEAQKESLAKRAGRQLLVALHEATLGKPFTEIVFDEYQSISSISAKSLYLTVCIMHRLGIATRAGLISRVNGIPFRMFKEKLFDPLEFIVFAREDRIIGDYMYQSRHSHIADLVFEKVLTNAQDRFDEYVRVIGALDVSYNTDREAFIGLLKARPLIELFSDPQMIRQIYSIGEKRDVNNPFLMQQEAIFEMNSLGGSLDKASSILQKAHKMAPHIRSISHSLSELALKKAERAGSFIEKNKYRQEARTIAVQLIQNSSIKSHPIHTLLKIGIDELNDSIANDDEPTLQRKIKAIEQELQRAVQLFPDDSFIFDTEAKFSALIDRYPRAIESLKKAFSLNKRSGYIAIRLAKMYENQKDIPNATQVLKDCLEANPSDKSVNYKLATLLAKNHLGSLAEIKFYLRRSFTEGDSNYSAQFWFARCLYIENDFEGAYKIFYYLRGINLDVRIKREPRGIIHENDHPVDYHGIVANLESSYGFLLRDELQDRIFAHKYHSEEYWASLMPHRRVTFNLAFSYRGPAAINIKPETS
ncbi:MAG: SIR2 family protein [Desulfobacterales bacterium]